MLKRVIALEDRTMRMPGKRGALILILSVFCGSLLVGNSAAQEPWVDPEDIEIPSLNKIKEIKPDRVEFKNGMIVYFLEDHDFPVVDVRAILRAGSVYEPAEKAGLAAITGQVMRTGGSTTTDGDALDERLESLGASVEINIGNTQGFATVSTLAEDLEPGLRILSELLRAPAFPEDKIDLAKKQQRTAIAGRNDEHVNILVREMLKLIYGEGHPYARHTEYATIDAITRDDLVAFHEQYVFPDRIIMTVYGDFKKKDVQKLLTEVFGGWARSTEALPPDPTVEQTAIQGNFLADKADLTNSIIVIGQEGMRMDNADYAPMQVFHEMMGGGFAGRLMNEIRSKRGLAYGTGSFSGAGLHHPGPQGFWVMTQAESTIVTLEYLNDEIDKAVTDGFTEDELKLAKDAILNSLVFSLSSKGAVLNRMASYEFYGYPMDFLTRYQEEVQGMTAEKVLETAKRNIRYPAMATIIVGEKTKFESDLASLGDVTAIDISIPEPEGEEIPAATAADLERGQGLLAAAAEACGASAMAALTDMTVAAKGAFVIQGTELQLAITIVRQFPDCEHNEIKLPMGTIIQSMCGDVAWMDQMGQGAQEMPADVKKKSAAEQPRDLVNVLTRHQDLKLQALPKSADIEGRPADVIFVHHDDISGWKIYLDQETHRIVRMDYRDQSPTGAPVNAQELLMNYQDVGDGISWPHTRQILHDEEPFITLDVTSIDFNTGVDSGLFQMPE